MTNEIKSPTSEELAALIEADKRARAEAFKSALEEITARYRCRLVPTVSIIGANIQTGLTIEPE